MKNITEKQKKYYEVYQEEGSYRKASEKLGVSHPVVYEQVKSVEEKISEVEDFIDN